MRIAQIAPISERVPPKKYGGTERVVHELTEELVKRGHDVTLFASGDSETSAKLSAIVPVSLREAKLKDPYGLNEWSFLHVAMAYERQAEFDIIHDHNRIISIPTANLSHTPVVLTMHEMFHDSNIPLYEACNKVNIVTISKAQAPKNANLNIAGTVYNGQDMHDYPFSNNPQGYLLFVGRINIEKGVHYAIEVALRLNLPLIIAGRVGDFDVEYYETKIKPKLNNRQITWVGEVDADERNELMKHAIATLHPVTWPEPFGLTIIESMACGTPVIAFRQGSIPELIKDWKSGFVVENTQQMVDAVKQVHKIDRKRCREYVLEKFNPQRMADGYEAIYRKILRANQQTTIQFPDMRKMVNVTKYTDTF